MATNIATGKLQEAGAAGRRQESGNRRFFFLRSAVCGLPPGFTLLELMIVITIIIILAAVVLPQYQKTILATREAVLRTTSSSCAVCWISMPPTNRSYLADSKIWLVRNTCARFPTTLLRENQTGCQCLAMIQTPLLVSQA